MQRFGLSVALLGLLACGTNRARADLVITAPAPITVVPNQLFGLAFSIQNTGSATLTPTQNFVVEIVSSGIPPTIMLTGQAPDAPPLAPNQPFPVPLFFSAGTLPPGVSRAVNTVTLEAFYTDPNTGQSFQPVGSTTVTVEAGPVALAPAPPTLALGVIGIATGLAATARRRGRSPRR
jgi:hypothetical protein